MIVLDTHILIWDALAPERLSTAAQRAILQGNQQDGIIIADITLWEIAMLIEKQRLQVEVESREFINLLLQANNLMVQPITSDIAARAVQLPDEVSKDPADRLIAATTLARSATLITADKNLQKAGLIPTLW